jgi:hypothetical protein
MVLIGRGPFVSTTEQGAADKRKEGIDQIARYRCDRHIRYNSIAAIAETRIPRQLLFDDFFACPGGWHHCLFVNPGGKSHLGLVDHNGRSERRSSSW